MIDLLKMLHENQITLDEAYDLKDEAVDKFASGEIKNWTSYLGLDLYETAALMSSTRLKDVEKFRYEGWSNSCIQCGKKIIKEKGGWWVDRDQNDNPVLRHLSCEDSYLKQVYGEDFFEAEN